MRVILLEDVKGAGKQGDVVNVSDGYARNYLLPRKLAAAADAGRLNSLQRHKDAQAHMAATAKERAQQAAARIDGKAVTIRAKSGENGRLFGSVSTKEIADALEKEFGIPFDKKKIVMKDHIKELGEYEAEIKLFTGVSATLRVLVTSGE